MRKIYPSRSKLGGLSSQDRNSPVNSVNGDRYLQIATTLNRGKNNYPAPLQQANQFFSP